MGVGSCVVAADHAGAFQSCVRVAGRDAELDPFDEFGEGEPPVLLLGQGNVSHDSRPNLPSGEPGRTVAKKEDVMPANTPRLWMPSLMLA
jgi:hypothetical protein